MNDVQIFVVIAVVGFVVTWLVLPSMKGAPDYTVRVHGDARRDHGHAEVRFHERLRRQSTTAGPDTSTSRTDAPAFHAAMDVWEAPPSWVYVLGVPRDSDRETIRRAYVNAMKAIHPDKVGEGSPDSSAQSARLTEAYEQAKRHVAERAVA